LNVSLGLPGNEKQYAGGALGSADEVHQSILFWESTARNFWMLGVSRSILSFVISLGSLSGGIPALTSGLADSMLAALYGMVLTFILSSCFAALMGMFLVAAPSEDRTAKIRGESVRTTLSRVAWCVFPLRTLIFLVAVFVVIVTPFEKQTVQMLMKAAGFIAVGLQGGDHAGDGAKGPQRHGKDRRLSRRVRAAQCDPSPL
jgi:hypothetical protein